MLIQAGLAAGLDRAQLVHVPNLAGPKEKDSRIPTADILRTWEVISVPLLEVGGAARTMDLWQLGTFGLWDYLFTTADTLTDALRASARYAAALADPTDEFTVTRDDTGLTLSWQGPYQDHMSYSMIAEFVPIAWIRKAASALGRQVTPLRVQLPHRAPPRHDHLVEMYGTGNIEFEADRPSVTFSRADADARLPSADPVLGAILDDHARTLVGGARSAVTWMDRFASALEAAFGAGSIGLDSVAGRLGMSPRTLQRRLDSEGTSWRQELDNLRQRRVGFMLRETSMSLESIAARVGYSDARALSRAVHRWYGHGPAAIRLGAHSTA